MLANLDNLDNFIADKSVVICYGASRYAFWIFLYLKLHNVEVECFLVSNNEKKDTYLGRSIYNCDDYSGNRAVIVALDEKHHKDIFHKLKIKHLESYYVTKQEIDNIIIYQSTPLMCEGG